MHFERSFDVGHYRCTATVDAPEGNRALVVILFDFAPASGMMILAERTAYQQAKEATLCEAAAALGVSPLVIESTAPARHGMPPPRHRGVG